MKELLERAERLINNFEQLFEMIKALFDATEDEKVIRNTSPYKFEYRTASWIRRVDEGDMCLKELIDMRDFHEKSRKEREYPVDRSYHGSLCEAIEVLQSRLPVTAEELRVRLSDGTFEPEDITFNLSTLEEMKSVGWKNAHQPVEVLEAELAAYRKVQAELAQVSL